MSAAKSCFFGCALPLLFALVVGIFFYAEAKEYTTSDIQSKMAVLRRQVARRLDPSSQDLPANQAPVPILMYHFVRNNVSETDDPLGYRLSLPEAAFNEQMNYLRTNGYTTIHLEDYLAGYYPAKSVILTFDDGYRDFRDVVWPVLQKNKQTATTFVIAGRLNDPNHLSKADVQYLAAQGIEIGSHSVNHSNLSRLDRQGLRTELGESKRIIEDLINRPIVTVAYPAGQFNNLVTEMTGRLGYEVAVTTESGWANRDNLFALSRVRISRSTTIEEFARLIKNPF